MVEKHKNCQENRMVKIFSQHTSVSNTKKNLEIKCPRLVG